jgi:Family of unknown function (DUF5330)
MGLFRLAAVVAVGVALLPAERAQQEHLYDRAAAATKWAITFCDRNGATCTQATQMWTQFTAKAEFGAKLAYDMVRDNDTLQTASTGKLDGARGFDFAPATFGSNAPRPFGPNGGTLSPNDLKPDWRGKPLSRGSF